MLLVLYLRAKVHFDLSIFKKNNLILGLIKKDNIHPYRLIPINMIYFDLHGIPIGICVITFTVFPWFLLHLNTFKPKLN